MLFRLNGFCYRNRGRSLINVSRRYARSKTRVDETIEMQDEVKHKRRRTPIITCKRSSFNFYIGDVIRKRDPILATKGWLHRDSRGDYFFLHPYDIDDDREGSTENNIRTFKELNLDPSLCSRLEDLSIEEPLKIQQLAIPLIFQGYNVVISAETGCGKTFSYLLPLITQVLKWKKMANRPVNSPLGLIVTPSRELAVQIGLELFRLCKGLGIITKSVTGGRTKKILQNPPAGPVDILVCSFGIISKLTTFRIYSLQFVKFVVLDEADALLHQTFEDKLRIFMERLQIGFHQKASELMLPTCAQLILVSATFPSRLKDVLNTIVSLDSLEHITTKNLHKILVVQKFMRVGSMQKPEELLKYVKPKTLNHERVIVFSNKVTTSHWITNFLENFGISATNLHGDMPLRIREGKYEEFLSGKALVLSTTDAGSRGLDTMMVKHILNYEFPLNTTDYIHRCGRTGRVGTAGECRVTNFISRPSEIAMIQRIERTVRRMKPIPIFRLLEQNGTNQPESEPEPEIVENLDNIEDVPY